MSMTDFKNSNEKKLINISSKHRTGGTTNNFEVYVGSNLRNVKALGLHTVELINSFYNINDYNNKLTVYMANAQSGLGSFTVTLPPKVYTINTLASNLKTLMNEQVRTIQSLAALENVFNVDYDSATYKLSISISAAFPTYNFLMYEPTSNTNNQNLLDVLGFEKHISVGGYYRFMTGTKLINLRGYSNVYIWSSIASNIGIDSKANYSTILGKLQINQPMGETIFYQCHDMQLDKFNINDRAVDVIRIQLRDEDGNIIDNNNMEWSLSLIAYL